MSSHGSIPSTAQRPWLRAALAGLVALAALVAGARLGSGLAWAAAAPAPQPDQPKKDEPKKEEPRKDEPKAKPAAEQNAFPEIDGLIGGTVPANLSAEQREIIRQQVRKMMEMSRMMMAQQQLPRGFRGFGAFGMVEQGRLGVRVEKPSATLVEQLDLPQGQGLVVEAVEADSAAAKAGIKAHDILLELNGKSVPDAVPELAKQIEDIKANTPVDAVVLRKGKRETVKGISLPEAAASPAPVPGFNFPAALPFQRPAVAPQALTDLLELGGGRANGVMTTTFRAGDRVTTRHQEGSLIITVTGTVADGKLKVNEVRVQDGNSNEKYDSVDKVAEAYRDKVKNLVEMSEKSAKITVQP
jgi:membrane-associated protease RseP (regulator of RpoE activity)